MSKDNGFDDEFYYFFNDNFRLVKSISRINNIWKKAFLNKAELITIDFGKEKDAYIDVYAEHSLSNDFGVRTFRKRGG